MFHKRYGQQTTGRDTFPLAMNHLGHLLLSGDDPEVITGNFMADAVKGRDLSAHPPGVQRGIQLHRRIDVFTDGHPITLEGRKRLWAHCGKYAGVALDLFYDHCIAVTWDATMGTLDAFSARMYGILTTHSHLMPERTQRMLPYMVEGDWLTNYRDPEGVAWALRGLARRVPNAGALVGAERLLVLHHERYVAECTAFLADLRKHLHSEEG